MNVGDRVSREVYMDDGTWQREGDACLDWQSKRTAGRSCTW